MDKPIGFFVKGIPYTVELSDTIARQDRMSDEGKQSSVGEDHLCLGQKPTVLAMLQKKGEKSANQGAGEAVQFSDLVIKINRKGKEQSRCMLITDRAVYNLVPNDKYNNVKRRIPLERIAAITKSTMR